jgi:hypothetical protein
MIVEQRTYTLYPGKVPQYLEIYRRDVYDLQVRTLGNMVGYFTTEMGTLNQIIHMWSYDDLEDRRKRREKLFADPQWIAFLEKVLPLIVKMENQILVPTSFSPVR